MPCRHERQQCDKCDECDRCAHCDHCDYIVITDGYVALANNHMMACGSTDSRQFTSTFHTITISFYKNTFANVGFEARWKVTGKCPRAVSRIPPPFPAKLLPF